jgi:hypothetical protein
VSAWNRDAHWRFAIQLPEDADPMSWKQAIQRMFALAGSVILSLALPACTSSGYPFLTNRNPNSDYSEYVVQRPTYGPDTGKPFFVGAYAGANYGPLFPRRAIQYDAGQVTVAPQPTVSVEHGAWQPD